MIVLVDKMVGVDMGIVAVIVRQHVTKTEPVIEAVGKMREDAAVIQVEGARRRMRMKNGMEVSGCVIARIDGAR